MTRIEEYLASKRMIRYELGTFDHFLRKMKFSFEIPSIHVTATNGKGSIVNFLTNIYKTTYSIGTFYSPTKTLNEMIRINNIPVSDQDIEKVFNEYERDFTKFELSEFEIQTFIAFKIFTLKKVDLCVIEVGMGGYDDATNVLKNNILSIIGRIGMEHSKYLGRSVSEIANNKAGIIKPNSPTLLIKQDEEIEFALKEVARKNKSEIFYLFQPSDVMFNINGWGFAYKNINDLVICTRAYYQMENACMAVEATEILKKIFPVSEDNIRKGLACECLPGRYYINKKYPRIIVDGAHNPHAIEELCKTLSCGQQSVQKVLFCSFKDKNIDKMLSFLATRCRDITITTYDNSRARKEEDYFLYLDDYAYNDNYKEVIKEYLSQEGSGTLLVCGSLDFAYTVIEYLERLK